MTPSRSGVSPREAGDALVRAADDIFLAGTRCTVCGFRSQHHEPSNHAYKRPVHPFVAALRAFVEAVTKDLN